MLARVSFPAHQMMLSLFCVTIIIIKTERFKWSLSCNTESPVISYGICAFPWLCPCTSCRHWASLKTGIRRLHMRKMWRKNFGIRALFLAHISTAVESFRTWKACSLPGSWSACFSLEVNGNFQHKRFTLHAPAIKCMISFSAGTASFLHTAKSAFTEG